MFRWDGLDNENDARLPRPNSQPCRRSLDGTDCGRNYRRFSGIFVRKICPPGAMVIFQPEAVCQV